MHSRLLPYLFSDFFAPSPSVYVISDSQMEAYKRSNAEAEIIELDKLIEGHEQSIERLKKTRELIRKDYPVLQQTEE